MEFGYSFSLCMLELVHSLPSLIMGKGFITALFETWYSYYLFILRNSVFLSIFLMDFYCFIVAYDIAIFFYPFSEKSNLLLRSLLCGEEQTEQFVAEIIILLQ